MQTCMTQTRTLCKWGAIFLALFSTSCVSHVRLSSAMQDRIGTKLNQQTFWLKQSLYSGPFYDDDRYRLMHPRRFEELTYLRTADGDTILPPPADEIIPVGTRIRVEKIEWPTGMNVFKRPIFTPRHWTWVYFQVARDRGPVTINREQTHILLLPSDVVDETSLEHWMRDIFSTQDTNEWLLSLDKVQRAAILEKRAVVGMDYDALSAAMGPPDQIRRELVNRDGNNVTKEIVTYGLTVVILEDGKVAKIEQVKK